MCVDNAILDIGCGDGLWWTREFFSKLGKCVVGIDKQANREWFRAKSTNAHYVVADAQKLPFRDVAFDLVFEKDVLHHVVSPLAVLLEMRRIARLHVVMIESNRFHPISYLHMVRLQGHNHFTQKRFESLASSLRGEYAVRFFYKEAHFLPTRSRILCRILVAYNTLMERIVPRFFLAYNIAVASKRLAGFEARVNFST